MFNIKKIINIINVLKERSGNTYYIGKLPSNEHGKGHGVGAGAASTSSLAYVGIKYPTLYDTTDLFEFHEADPFKEGKGEGKAAGLYNSGVADMLILDKHSYHDIQKIVLDYVIRGG